MAEFISNDLGISTNEMFSPGYVRFECTRWNLPDNSKGMGGWHIVYRPLAVDAGYTGHEHVTDAMRAAVLEHYTRARTAEAAKEAAASARRMARLHAIMARESDPEWQAKEAERARKEREYDLVQNEGYSDGYNPYRVSE